MEMTITPPVSLTIAAKEDGLSYHTRSLASIKLYYFKFMSVFYRLGLFCFLLQVYRLNSVEEEESFQEESCLVPAIHHCAVFTNQLEKSALDLRFCAVIGY